MLAALDREAPGLGLVRGARLEDPDTWNGPITTKPAWHVNQFSVLSASGWIGWGVATRDDIRAFVSIQIGTPKTQPSDPLTCGGHSRDCTISHGPNGERIRSTDADTWKVQPSGPEKPLAFRDVLILRPDGTEMLVRAMAQRTSSY